MAPNSDETLADLRAEIDRIDRSMHGLLMERGEIIDRIIAAKRRLGGGSAFHPGREAAMMRALAGRHTGLLPLDTAESIWRVIISTFTYIQMNYSVHADVSADEARIRDAARFHFGFTVPFVMHTSAASVIGTVAASCNDLGMVAIERNARAAPWWSMLARPDAPKIIARLPFVERPDHPAGLPVYVIAKPLAETASRDIMLYAVSIERWHDALPGAVASLGGEIVESAGDRVGLSMVIALPGHVDAVAVRQALTDAGAGEPRLSGIGSHAARFEVSAARQRPGVSAS